VEGNGLGWICGQTHKHLGFPSLRQQHIYLCIETPYSMYYHIISQNPQRNLWHWGINVLPNIQKKSK